MATKPHNFEYKLDFDKSTKEITMRVRVVNKNATKEDLERSFDDLKGKALFAWPFLKACL